MYRANRCIQCNKITLQHKLDYKFSQLSYLIRCHSAGLDFARQQKLLWKSAAKKILTEQATELQKRLDKKVLTQWKCSYNAIKNKKAPSKYLKDPPYALHTTNLQEELHPSWKTSTFKYDAEAFLENYKQIENSLKAIGDTIPITDLTPRSKQSELSAEIHRINDLRENINNLKLCTHLLMPES